MLHLVAAAAALCNFPLSLLLSNPDDAQIQPLAAGCSAFLCALAGYFLLLPLRDEAAVALGPAQLPRLFAASLLLTLLTATPLAATFLDRYPTKERGLQLLFRVLSLSVLGEPPCFVVQRCCQATPPPSCASPAPLQDSCCSTWQQAHLLRLALRGSPRRRLV